MRSILDGDHELQVAHGPDSPEHFDSFSIDTVITELKTHVPDLHRLFMTLGDVERNKKDADARPVEETRAVTSLCALLKARSVRVQGIQLLLGFMLVARSTNRQVSINMVDIHFVCTFTNVFFYAITGNNSFKPCWHMYIVHKHLGPSETTDNAIKVSGYSEKWPLAMGLR